MLECCMDMRIEVSESHSDSQTYISRSKIRLVKIMPSISVEDEAVMHT